MTGNEIPEAQLEALADIVEGLVEVDPWDRDRQGFPERCRFCRVEVGLLPLTARPSDVVDALPAHAQSCIWARAMEATTR